MPAAIYLLNVRFNEGNAEAELSPNSIWIYWSNSVSQPQEIKINYHDGETILTLIRGHHTDNHSFFPLWPSLPTAFFVLCSTADSGGSTQIAYRITSARRWKLDSLSSFHCFLGINHIGLNEKLRRLSCELGTVMQIKGRCCVDPFVVNVGQIARLAGRFFMQQIVSHLCKRCLH